MWDSKAAAAPGTVAGDPHEPNRTGLGGPNLVRLGGRRRRLGVASHIGLRPGLARPWPPTPDAVRVAP